MFSRIYHGSSLSRLSCPSPLSPRNIAILMLFYSILLIRIRRFLCRSLISGRDGVEHEFTFVGLASYSSKGFPSLHSLLNLNWLYRIPSSFLLLPFTFSDEIKEALIWESRILQSLNACFIIYPRKAPRAPPYRLINKLHINNILIIYNILPHHFVGPEPFQMEDWRGVKGNTDSVVRGTLARGSSYV